MLLPLLIFLIQGSYLKEANSLVGNTDLLVAYSTIGLVIVTIFLVVVTGYYAYQTRNTVREMKRATEIQFLPSLIATFVEISSDSRLTFKIKNIGRGPAFENKITLSVRENPNVNEEHEIQLLQPTDNEGKLIRFTAGYTISPDVNFEKTREYYRNNQRTVILRLNYKDIFDKEYQQEVTLDITSEEKERIY